MTTIRYIRDGTVIAEENTNVAEDTADIASQFRQGQVVEVAGDRHEINNVRQNIDQGTVDVILQS